MGHYYTLETRGDFEIIFAAATSITADQMGQQNSTKFLLEENATNPCMLVIF